MSESQPTPTGNATMPAPLFGRVALVTGGTRGIGAGIAFSLAQHGARVIVTGRDQANANDVVSQIEAAGGSAGAIAADLFDDDAVGSLISDVVGKFGKIDILVNNAGIDADAPALGYDLDAWRRVLRFNLEVPFRLCQEAAQHFAQNGGGAIVNIASVLGHVGTAEACSYVAAKHGLLGLTKTLAIEWSHQGVRVNAVAPGLIQTDMTKYIWESEISAAYVSNRIPLGRIGLPADIGGAVAYLASDAAAFVHGECIVVDGGFLAT